MDDLLRVVWISLGGAVGTAARALLSSWALRTLGPAFPYGTLLVNVVGSFLLSAIMYVGLATTWLSPTARLVLTTGVMGGFTTYSSFNFETLRAWQQGAWLLGVLNVLITVSACLLAGLLGNSLARLLVRA
jgi:CrcB protein